VVWEFPWGKWIVNANATAKSVNVAGFAALRRAVPGTAAVFSPLEANPFAGAWNSAAIPATRIELPAFSQAILIDPQNCPNCLGLSGDFNGDGPVDH
jgi:hypothetical protein